MTDVTRDPRGFLIQHEPGQCFAYAALNALVARGHEVPDEKAAQVAGMPQFGYQEMIRAAGLASVLFEATNPEAVFDNGGILTVWHPIWEGHATLVLPHDEAHVVAVNSWLGPNVSMFGVSQLAEYMPVWPAHHRHWAFTAKTKWRG